MKRRDFFRTSLGAALAGLALLKPAIVFAELRVAQAPVLRPLRHGLAVKQVGATLRFTPEDYQVLGQS